MTHTCKSCGCTLPNIPDSCTFDNFECGVCFDATKAVGAHYERKNNALYINSETEPWTKLGNRDFRNA